MINTKRILSLYLGIMCLYTIPVSAQESPDQFFAPVKSRDLVTELPPRVDQERTFSVNNTDFFDFSGRSNGCPDTINIGSIDGDSDIFGNPRIEVIIENDIIIDCGGL